MTGSTLLHLGHLAAHLRAHPPAALPWPQQARFGNCWLLTALVGIGVNALLDRVALHPTFAQVSLAHCSVRVDYCPRASLRSARPRTSTARSSARPCARC